MKRTVTILLLLSASYAYSCSVMFYSFCATVDSYHVVAKCVMIDSVVQGRRFQVLDVIKGTENRDTITVWNGVDFDCNGPWSLSAEYMCNIGDTILAALTPSGNDYIRTYNFGYVPELQLRNDTLRGLVYGIGMLGPPSSTIMEMAYNDFVQHWNTYGQSCNEILGINAHQTDALHLYPNPVTEELFFSSALSEVPYALYNPTGTRIKVGLISGSSIHLNDVASGVYFLELKTKSRAGYFRILKK